MGLVCLGFCSCLRTSHFLHVTHTQARATRVFCFLRGLLCASSAQGHHGRAGGPGRPQRRAVQVETPGLYGMTDNGLRDARDREKKYLTELIEKLNNAFGKDITDTDQVAFAVHVSEKLRADPVVMAQVRNNTLEQALKADLPTRAVAAIAAAMSSHTSQATKLLSDESTPDLFVTVLYELLKRTQLQNCWARQGADRGRRRSEKDHAALLRAASASLGLRPGRRGARIRLITVPVVAGWRSASQTQGATVPGGST